MADMIEKGSSHSPIERVTRGMAVCDTNHAQIHDGNAFSLTGSIDVAQAKTGAILINAPLAVKATKTFNMTAATSDLTYTDISGGVEGNEISVVHVDPAANNAVLAVSVSGKKITVSLATGAGGAITSTAALVKAAVNAHAVAGAMVTCEDEGVGSGLVNAMAEAFLSGGAARPYVHFQAALVESNAGPASVTILENYTMDGTALAAASALTPINHNRLSDQISNISVKAHADVTATAEANPLTLATIPMNGTGAGATKVGSATGIPEEFVLANGKNYLIAFSNPAVVAGVKFVYHLFWYEEGGA